MFCHGLTVPRKQGYNLTKEDGPGNRGAGRHLFRDTSAGEIGISCTPFREAPVRLPENLNRAVHRQNHPPARPGGDLSAKTPMRKGICHVHCT
ncbi:hypothetical protein SUBVAR_06825 [Subdoligranulum variabile DSM 15176]|uniref:Uncharacterized protein n=1 Tax=Subdoligranulum variabile DSM 15176 TaxID=411471 RepID=D1PQZ8_9FIRM|nr:hypothetical protein SUBVAR_06825 [Subdoligranulum variabile DSM 15176]